MLAKKFAKKTFFWFHMAHLALFVWPYSKVELSNCNRELFVRKIEAPPTFGTPNKSDVGVDDVRVPTLPRETTSHVRNHLTSALVPPHHAAQERQTQA